MTPQRRRVSGAVVALVVLIVGSAVVLGLAGATPATTLQPYIAAGRIATPGTPSTSTPRTTAPTTVPTTLPSAPVIIPLAPPDRTTRVVAVPTVTVEDDQGNPSDPRSDDTTGAAPASTTTTVAPNGAPPDR